MTVFAEELRELDASLLELYVQARAKGAHYLVYLTYEKEINHYRFYTSYFVLKTFLLDCSLKPRAQLRDRHQRILLGCRHVLW